MQLKAKSLEDIKEEFEQKYVGRYCVSINQPPPQVLLKYKALIKIKGVEALDEEDRWVVIVEAVHNGELTNFDLSALQNNFGFVDDLDSYIKHLEIIQKKCEMYNAGVELEKIKIAKLEHFKKTAKKKKKNVEEK